MRYAMIALWASWALCCGSAPAVAQVSIGIGLPNVSIGINLPVYPQLVRVPNYPVYYAPGLQENYFFYDGVYWVYQGDNWYASSWYNGPWGLVGPEQVPLYVLRVPVRYYRSPPVYFRGWQRDAPPRWGEHWGRDWEQRRPGWDRFDRRAAPPPAPLPRYQRNYTGERYPGADRQREIQGQNYRYQPRDPAVRPHFAPPREERAPVLHEKHTMPNNEPQPRAAPPGARQDPGRGRGRENDKDRHDNNNDRERGDNRRQDRDNRN